METKNTNRETIELESMLASISGQQNGIQYAGKILQERDKLIEALNKFQGSAKDINFLKGDVAEIWHAGTFNINAAQKNSTDHAETPRSTEYGSPDVVLDSGKEFQLKYYKNAKKSAEAQAISNKQATKNPSTQKGATDKIESGTVNENDPVYKGQGRVVPSDQAEDCKKELGKKIAKEKENRPEQAGRYEETEEHITDRVQNDEGVSSEPLTEKGSREITKDAKEGKVTPESTNLTNKDVIKLQYVMKNAVKAGLQSAVISAGISTVLSLSKKLIEENKTFWEYNEEDWKEVLFDIGIGAMSGGVSASVLYIVGSYSASAVPGASALLMATFGIASLVPDYVEGKLTTDEFIKEAEIICFDAAVILLAGVLGQATIPVPGLGMAIGSVAGMIAVFIIEKIWGDELRELIEKFNQFIKNLFEKIKEFFDRIWQKLKEIKDLQAYLLDDDFNHNLSCKFKNLISESNEHERRETVSVNVKKVERIECYE